MVQYDAMILPHFEDSEHHHPSRALSLSLQVTNNLGASQWQVLLYPLHSLFPAEELQTVALV